MHETIVSAVHGNAAVSDTVRPVTINHFARGVVLKPVLGLSSPPEGAALEGKVHFALPTLHSPQEQLPQGPVIESISLEMGVAPHSGDIERDGDKDMLPLHRQTKVTQVDLYAGRELVGSWGREGSGGELPSDHDFAIHLHSGIYANEEEKAFQLNDNSGGLGVTVTVEFRGANPAILISSVAVIHTLRAEGFCGFGFGGY